jgi:hypothetical protein
MLAAGAGTRRAFLPAFGSSREYAVRGVVPSPTSKQDHGDRLPVCPFVRLQIEELNEGKGAGWLPSR